MINFAIIFYIMLSMIIDIIVFCSIGRWNRFNIFSPVRFLLVIMILLLQIPAWITTVSDRAVGHEFNIACGLVASAIAPLLVLLGATLLIAFISRIMNDRTDDFEQLEAYAAGTGAAEGVYST